MNKSRELLIGIFACVMLAILYWGINFLKGENLFSNKRYFYAVYENVDGLTISRPVTVNGFRVGQVSNINFSKNKKNDPLFYKFPEEITSLQWHSYEVQGLEENNDVTHLASSSETKYQIFKYQDHAYGIQFHIEVKDTTVNEWGCVPQYKSALEKQLGPGALEKFDKEAQANMKNMNNYSNILYSKFKSDILKKQKE